MKSNMDDYLMKYMEHLHPIMKENMGKHIYLDNTYPELSEKRVN